MEPYSLGSEQGKVLPHIGRLIATAIQTNGSFEVIDYMGPAAPPPHVHQMRDEGFYILDGSFTFTLTEDVVEVGVGSFIFVPRGNPAWIHGSAGRQSAPVHRASGIGGVFRGTRSRTGGREIRAEIREVLAGKYDSTPL